MRVWELLGGGADLGEPGAQGLDLSIQGIAFLLLLSASACCSASLRSNASSSWRGTTSMRLGAGGTRASCQAATVKIALLRVLKDHRRTKDAYVGDAMAQGDLTDAVTMQLQGF